MAEVLSLIKEILNQERLKDRCELSVDQSTTLLEICLTITSFSYNGVFYKLKKVAAMGSPVSPIVANLTIEHFEERSTRKAPHPPYIWLRYVDDTFTVLQESEVEHFTQHLICMDEYIKFTVEIGRNNTLALLETYILCLKDDS